MRGFGFWLAELIDGLKDSSSISCFTLGVGVHSRLRDLDSGGVRVFQLKNIILVRQGSVATY